VNRIKVLLLGLIALGLCIAQLSIVSSAVASKASEQTSNALLGAPAAIAQRIESGRSELQAAALKLASNPALYVKGPAQALTPDRFSQVRSAVHERLTEAAKATSWVALITDNGALMALGNADPSPPPQEFDLKSAATGGGDGVLVELNGAPCLFYSVPIVAAEKGEPRAAGSVVIGAPLWGSFANADALADAINKELNLGGVGLWMKGKLIGAAGKKEDLDKAFKASKPGQTTPLSEGSVSSLGPIKLPMFVSTGLEIAARREIPGTPFEVLALGSSRPFMESLAGAQKSALFMIFGLIAAMLALTFLGGGGVRDEEEAPVRAPAPSAPKSATGERPKFEPLANTMPIKTSEPAEASPDDFNFPPPPDRAPPPIDNGPAEDPFAVAAPVGGSSPPAISFGDENDEGERTRAYPANAVPGMQSGQVTAEQPALDPFAVGAADFGDPSQPPPPDFNPDATRVAMIPPELLKSSRRDVTGPTAAHTAHKIPGATVPSVAAPRVAAVGGGGGDEETHFQETFRDFLATRQKCGEPNDGMTYDKFAAKLRKNKEQLVAKYNCRTVRFQVYVKEGKAALKATPVKD
jgi:hypothetical protein